MLPPYFDKLAEYFLIPLTVLAISYAVADQFRLKYSAGTDFFILFLSTDLGAVIEYETSRNLINPIFSSHYLSVFAVLISLCVLLVIVAGRTQRKIDAYRDYKLKASTWKSSWPVPAPPVAKYPLTGVVVCWIATMTLLPTHLFLFFGKANQR